MSQQSLQLTICNTFVNMREGKKNPGTEHDFLLKCHWKPRNIYISAAAQQEILLLLYKIKNAKIISCKVSLARSPLWLR